MQAFAVEVVAVHKRFGAVIALDGIELSIAPAEVLVLFGPTGCGKSTLLRVLAGLEQPDDGRVLLGGRDAARLPPSQRGLSLVFQHDALYPHMNVLENLRFASRGREQQGRPFDESVAELEELAELSGLLNRRPAELSGGQRQRAAVARALIREPSLLLLDEPGGHWDAPLRRRMRRRLKQWSRRRQAAVVWVTHDRDEAFAAADRLAVMQHGKILQNDPPRVAYHRPLSLAVANMLTSPTINAWERSLPTRSESETSSAGRSRFGPFAMADGLVPHEASTLALRPECIGWRPAGEGRAPGMPKDGHSIDAILAEVEELGDRRILIWESGEFEVVSVDNTSRSLTMGQAASLHVAHGDLMWF